LPRSIGDWLARDEAWRVRPDVRRGLEDGAPAEAEIYETGDITATLDARRSAHIRDDMLALAHEFDDHDPTPGLSLYPDTDDTRHIQSCVLVWRDGRGEIVGAGALFGADKPIDVPADLRKHFEAWDTHRETPTQRKEFLDWFQEQVPRLEGGEVAGLGVVEGARDEDRRAAVKDMQTFFSRHRVHRRFEHEARGKLKGQLISTSRLTVDGARSLNAHRANSVLVSGAALALVGNPQALDELVKMPDTGRTLTRGEIVRGTMDLADLGGRQFHAEAMAVKAALRPLVADPEAYQGRFGFPLRDMRGTFIINEKRGVLRDIFFEDALGKRLQEHENAARTSHGGRPTNDGAERAAPSPANGGRTEGSRALEAGRGPEAAGVPQGAARRPEVDLWDGVTAARITAEDLRAHEDAKRGVGLGYEGFAQTRGRDKGPSR
jgi:hypothetical protein